MTAPPDLTVVITADTTSYVASIKRIRASLGHIVRVTSTMRDLLRAFGLLSRRGRYPHGMTMQHWIEHHARKPHPKVKPNRSRIHRRRNR